MQKDEILNIFKKSKAILEGHFQLTSGRHSDCYLQCALVLQDPQASEILCRELVKMIPQGKINLVIGPALGGIILAYETGRQLGTLALFAERQNGVMTLRRGFQIPPGSKVLVVEDVITTGGSVRDVIDVVKEHGGEVTAVASLVDRSNNMVDFGVPLYSLLPMEVVSYLPQECPLCKKGVPIVKPGSRNNPGQVE